MKFRTLPAVAALSLAVLAASPGASQADAQGIEAASCEPSKGWVKRVRKFSSKPMEKQLRKVEFEDNLISTHAMGAKRVFGIIDGRVRTYLQQKTLDTGPVHRLVLEERVGGRQYGNPHRNHTVEMMVNGHYIELNKGGYEKPYNACGQDGCSSMLRSFYVIPPELFETIEAMPNTVLMPLRIRQGGRDYRVCRDYMPAAEFKLLRAAIAQGSQ